MLDQSMTISTLGGGTLSFSYVKTLVVVLIGFRFIVDIQGQVFPMGYPINAPSPYHYLPSPLKY
jgi:hypothetical protein